MTDMPPNWPFADPPNMAVFTVRSIIERAAPILLVSHDEEDGAWQFYDGADVRMEDAMIVSLHNIWRRDPSIAEVADLPEGWRASRQMRDSEWVRERRS